VRGNLGSFRPYRPARLIEATVVPLAPDPFRLEIEGLAVALPAAAAANALILHELATKAIKYGGWSSEQGRAIVKRSVPAKNKLEFHWRELGGTVSINSTNKGIGGRVINNALNNANVRHEIGFEATDCYIEVPS